MKAEKLSSGNWRVRVFDKATGKTVSITKKSKKEAERAGEKWYLEHSDGRGITFGAAYNGYIASKVNVLSPNTIQTYRDYEVYYKDISDYPLSNITNEMLQNIVNKLAKDHKPKTVKNIYGLVTACYSLYEPNRRLNVTLPKNMPSNAHTPSEEEIDRLIELSKGTELHIPILLAVYATMRLSEITALDLDHINGQSIHIEYAMALKDGEYVKKSPKTAAGDRWAVCPQFVIDKIFEQGYVTHLTSQQITDRFRRFIKKHGFEKFTFHRLRHYSASKQHALGIPDVYIMEQGGWETDHVLKQVYRHALQEERKTHSAAWLEYGNKKKE